MRTLKRTRWEMEAACAYAEDPEIFFEIENAVDEERISNPVKIAEALSTCDSCPIIDRCFHEAVYSRSVGIWGGTTASERGVRYKMSRKQ